VGDFSTETAVPLAQLSTDNWEEHLLPSDTAVAHLPRINLTAVETKRLQNGQRPPRPANQSPTPLLRAYDPTGQFVGIITAHEEYLQAQKMFL
jgi:tRNA U55 pseudouridine synthase TruB